MQKHVPNHQTDGECQKKNRFLAFHLLSEASFVRVTNVSRKNQMGQTAQVKWQQFDHSDLISGWDLKISS